MTTWRNGSAFGFDCRMFPIYGYQKVAGSSPAVVIKFFLFITNFYKWIVDYVDQYPFLLEGLVVYNCSSCFKGCPSFLVLKRGELSSYFPAPIVHFYSVYVACNHYASSVTAYHAYSVYLLCLMYESLRDQ